MGAVVVPYLGVLLAGPAAPSWLREGVLGNLACLTWVVVLLRRARRLPEERGATLPLVGALVSFMVGANLVAVETLAQGAVSPPSPSDIAFLLFYPFCLAGLLAGMSAHLRGLRLVVGVDGLTGALAGAAVATCAISPLIAAVWDGSPAAVVSLAYPVGDVLLVAAALGALGLVGLRQGRGFLLWAVGMMVFGVADIVYAYRLAFGHFVVGTPLDGLWLLGLGLMTAGTIAPRGATLRRRPGPGSMGVVGLSAAVAMAVLAVAPPLDLDPVPSMLALIAVATAGIRLVLVVRQLRELADVRQQARTDELTGAANRRALYSALDRGLTPVRPVDGGSEAVAPFGLALVDLDHFKEVNDSFGHAAGDDLLRAVVARFTQALDDVAVPFLLARLGGDEFAVLLRGTASRNAAMACGTALQESLREPVVLDGVVLHVQASIGIALAPDHAVTRGDILFAADAAMYAAKTTGERVSFYSPTAVGDRRKRLEIAEDLYAALERGELTVDYQPIVAAGGGLVGAEALVRWDHPTRGRLSPAEFLDIAERYRLTSGIARRVLDVALTDLRRWRDAGHHPRISVNVSASDLRDEQLVDIVASALLTHEVPPSVLTIEVTETAMMSDPAMAHRVMRALAEVGVRLAVDDYGTGYSSLEYLLKLPIDEIKLDRAFSVDLVDELRSVAIVRSTVDLTHALGLRMVAEGVEDERTLTILQDLGCDLVQGWHLGRPMPADRFGTLLAAQPPLATKPLT